jgi:outer membrane protein
MKRWPIKLITVALAATMSISAQAADLVEVFQQAYVNDPSFQNALATFQANQENIPIARSSLLPQITSTANSLYNHAVSKMPASPLAQTISNLTGVPFQQVYNYNSNQYQLNVSQTVFNYEQWVTLIQAKDGVKAANATFNAAYQGLMATVAQAYFNVLDAEDNLRFIEAQKAAIYRQLDQVEQQFKVGLVAITGVYQAQAAYDNVVAQEIEAQNRIVNRREDLRAITGRYYDHLAALSSDVPLVSPEPSNVEQWVDMSVQQNWALVAARYSAKAARDQINIERAGHLPVLDAVATTGETRSGNSPFTGQQDIYANSIGLELTLPIYQGGLVTAQTKQATYEWQAAVDNQELAYRTAVNDTRQEFNNVIAGISKIKADKQAIISNKASLESTFEAYKVGTQTMLDVLQSQQTLYNTLHVFASDQYAYIDALVALKEAAGTLNVNDLQIINAWLTENHPSYDFITTNSLQKTANAPIKTKDLTSKKIDTLDTSPTLEEKEKMLNKLTQPKSPKPSEESLITPIREGAGA